MNYYIKRFRRLVLCVVLLLPMVNFLKAKDTIVFEIKRKSSLENDKNIFTIKNVSKKTLVILSHYRLGKSVENAIFWKSESKFGEVRCKKESYSFPATPFPKQVGQYLYIPPQCSFDVKIPVEGEREDKVTFGIRYFDPNIKTRNLRKVFQSTTVELLRAKPEKEKEDKNK